MILSFLLLYRTARLEIDIFLKNPYEVSLGVVSRGGVQLIYARNQVLDWVRLTLANHHGG